MKVNMTRAIMFEAARAVVRHKKIGTFLSEFEADDPYPLRGCKLGPIVYEARFGSARTDWGNWINVTTSVVFIPQQITGAHLHDTIEKVVVGIRNQKEDPRYTMYYECRLDYDEGFQVTELSGSPF